MELTFLGAAHEVTGSRFLLNACGKHIMVDYGMEQGADMYENAPLPIMESQIDYVLLTHAHIDHSGYLPLLYKNGFRGTVVSTRATAELCRIMLLDSAHIQESDAEWKNRKAERSGKSFVEPLYTSEHATGVCQLFSPIDYGATVDLCDGVRVRAVDVGHLLGSSSIEVTITENGEETVLVFSGDIGNVNQPLLRDPQYMSKADIVVMESTYGDRSHGPVPDYIASLTRVLQSTFDKGGNVVIPSFAVGRTQEMLYFIRQIKQQGLVKGHGSFTVYVDSPLAIEATNVFNENTLECADEETLKLIRAGVNPITFDGLKIAVSADESKLINDDKEPKVIISASGMCDAGRVRHHLKHNLWRPECTVLFVGYQSVGTLGRSLVDGAKHVKLFDETIEVRASIEKLAGVSGHADNNGLIRWISSFDPKPKQVFVVHGDDEVCDVFAARLHDELGLQAVAPYNGERWSLAPLELLAEGNKRRLKEPDEELAAMGLELKSAAPVAPEKSAAREVAAAKGSASRGSARQEYAHEGATPQKRGKASSRRYGETQEFLQLSLAGERITSLINAMRARSKKDQRKLTSQLNMLLRRFGRK